MSWFKTAEQLEAERVKQALEQRIQELKQLLSNSDYKVMSDYDKTNDTILADRQAWREEIRTLEVSINGN
jgi:hypothetical protein